MSHAHVASTVDRHKAPTAPRKRLLLDALNTFEVAARHSHFGDAAAELGVTASAVSHQIKRLENHLGIALFDRSERLPRLSKAGLDLAGPLSSLFGRMGALIADLQNESSGLLTVSVMSAFGSKWLAPRVIRFSQKHPELRVRIESSDQLVDFPNESVDVGLRFGNGIYSGLDAEHLMDVDARPVCSPSLLTASGCSTWRPDQLLGHTLLHDESSLRAPGLPNWPRWLEASGLAAPGHVAGIVFENPQLALEAALAGHGVALGLSPLVQDDLRSGRLVCPINTSLRSSFSFWLVNLPDRASMPKIRKFRNWLMDEVSLATPLQ